jgi:hypothetical protein
MPTTATSCGHLIDLARTFDIRTVAEWVETEEDAALLREWKVDLMQGNYFGEASLTPPWAEAADAPGFMAENAVPFVLPSDMAWIEESEEEEAEGDLSFDTPAAVAAPETAQEAFGFAEPQEEALHDAEPEYAEPEHPEPQYAEPAGSEPALAEETFSEPVYAGAAPELEIVEAFEDGLAGELAKLRQAIAALDSAFKRQPVQAEPEILPEPSFADLVSDTAMRAAG